MWESKIFLYFPLIYACTAFEYDISALQLQDFKNHNPAPVGVLTTLTGSPVTVNETSVINSNLILNRYFIDSITHIDRERIPERIVHAKGAGAFGYFEVTHDITDICKADFLSNVGKITPIAIRFSPVAGRSGSIDTSRDIHGFAVKFYTQEGNWDMVGTGNPMFGIKDPALFSSLIHSVKTNPKTNFFDFGMKWDFRNLRTETLNLVMYLSSDYGIFDGYRRQPGFSIHTYQIENNEGVPSFVRFHFLPDLGIKTLTSTEAKTIGGKDPDYSARDLYNAIETGNYPSWTFYVQVLTLADIQRVDFDPFDVTRTIPTDQFPLRPVGKLVLNKNPVNYFAEVEQIAFSPGNLVPGIIGAPDKLFESRVFSYSDAQRHRLGSNFNKIAVNCPLRSLTYVRDGLPPVKDNTYDVPNYYPNSFSGPEPITDTTSTPLIQVFTDSRPTNYDQTLDFYENLNEDQKVRLVEVITAEILCIPKIVQDRVIKTLAGISTDLGNRLGTQVYTNATSYECAKY